MTSQPPIRLGIVGVNTWHIEAFSDVILGTGPAAHLGALSSVEVTSVWGEPANEREKFAQKLDAREYDADPGEMISAIDLAIVIDDTSGGARHRELAEPFLRAGIPTFVDKPMTLEISDARALFALAAEHDAPLLSSSALRFSNELRDAAERLDAIGDIRTVNILGPGEWYYYGVHAVELLLSVITTPVRWVQRHVSSHQDIAVVGFEDGRLATVTVLREAYYTFAATAYGTQGWAQIEVTKNYEFYRALIEAAVGMVATRRSPVPADRTLDVLKVLHAGIRSADQNRPVFVSEVD